MHRVHKVSRCCAAVSRLADRSGCRWRPGPRGRPRRLPGGSVPGVIGLVVLGAVLEINALYHSLPEHQSIRIPLPRGPDRVQNRPSTPQTRSPAAGYGTTQDRQHGARGKKEAQAVAEAAYRECTRRSGAARTQPDFLGSLRRLRARKDYDIILI